ncbi:MAG: hypothetical protein ACK5M7_09245 [Draconibacterium sp.]
MNKQKIYPKWIYIAFPAVAMMLGWGLRGHIGGGPYGAMIPGAMIALCMSLLLELPAGAASFLVVFGVIGIGLGGEMTYGQTLGFLRSPETVWWGTAGTTLKGAVWGLLGGAVLALGFFFRSTPRKVLVWAFLLMIAGIILGFKLINDPMLLYFSDRAKPRAESWAGLLLGAVFLLVYLKLKLSSGHFKIILRFAFWGMIGGGLGFGLGGFWLVLGSRLQGLIYTDWWKAMEFTFGLLLGASLGYATWLSRNDLAFLKKDGLSAEETVFPGWKELMVGLGTGLLIFWVLPLLIEGLGNVKLDNNMPGGSLKNEVIRLVDNYSVTGLIFILVLMRYPKAAWQIGITLTFSHTAIDLFRDFYPETNFASAFTMHFLWVLLTTVTVALLVAYFERRNRNIQHLFLVLIWSCIGSSVLRMFVHPGNFNVAGLSFCQGVCGRFIVDIIFVVSAIVLTVFIQRKFRVEGK